MYTISEIDRGSPEEIVAFNTDTIFDEKPFDALIEIRTTRRTIRNASLLFLFWYKVRPAYVAARKAKRQPW